MTKRKNKSMMLIILVAVAAGGYYVYTKYFKGQGGTTAGNPSTGLTI